MSRLRTLWPYAVALGAAYLAVPLIGGAVLDAQGADPAVVKGRHITALLGYFPALTFGAAVLAGYRHGLAWLLAPLAAVAFLPAMFVVYNDSALVYTVVYAASAGIGLAAGVGLRRVRAGGWGAPRT